MNHRGVDCHLLGLECLLLVRELSPGNGLVDFAGSENFQCIGEMIGRPQVSLWLGKIRCAFLIEQPHLAHLHPALSPNRIPTRGINRIVNRDVFRERVKWEMGSGKCEVVEKRLVRVIRRVFPQHLDDMISESGCRVVTRASLDRRKLFVVFPKSRWIEKPALIFHQV